MNESPPAKWYHIGWGRRSVEEAMKHHPPTGIQRAAVHATIRVLKVKESSFLQPIILTVEDMKSNLKMELKRRSGTFQTPVP